MTFRKTEGTGNWKRTHSIAFCGELTVDEAVELSWEGNEMNDSLLHPPEANSVIRTIEKTCFSGDDKPTCYSAQWKNQNDCKLLTSSIINIAFNKLILWVKGRAHFTEKYTKPKQVFRRTKKSNIKSLIICIIAFKILKVWNLLHKTYSP
jgi:hypothetical protein